MDKPKVLVIGSGTIGKSTLSLMKGVVDVIESPPPISSSYLLKNVIDSKGINPLDVYLPKKRKSTNFTPPKKKRKKR